MSEYSPIVEEKAKAAVQWLVAKKQIENDPKAIKASMKYALHFAEIDEENKLHRKFTLVDKPFAGCNAICHIEGRLGGIEGPNDHCMVVNEESGELYFCKDPQVRSEDGSFPLCFNYHQSVQYNNPKGFNKVKSGKLIVKP